VPTTLTPSQVSASCPSIPICSASSVSEEDMLAACPPNGGSGEFVGARAQPRGAARAENLELWSAPGTKRGLYACERAGRGLGG
jgi:hypothetical protein